LAKLVVLRSSVFHDVVEMERSTLSLRSRKLFTLSAIYTATTALLAHREPQTMQEQAALAASFWEEVAKHFPEWHLVRDHKMTAADVRRDFIHSHGIALQAIGKIGNMLLQQDTTLWKRQLRRLKEINWSRANAKLWEGRAMIGGRVSKATHNVILTTNVLKKHFDLALTPDEQHVEDAFMRGDYDTK
jgi:DNA sulfur modification protein DndB